MGVIQSAPEGMKDKRSILSIQTNKKGLAGFPL
jgi:hypothetical protein